MQVFLSYSLADKIFAKQLASELSKQGYDVWDPEVEMSPGDKWLEQIGQALRRSKAMVVLLSPDSAKSELVRRDIEYALSNLNYAERLFPVLVRPTEDFPWILHNFHILRANNNPAEVSRRIASALKRVA
ncbi:MAG TPA: toll/interleukin-1 receptor domain-containing protein [Terriglobia bacterium]|nr:toll/interleukin-1 receptor domain-containing protein [Terriglobia bacterium]